MTTTLVKVKRYRNSFRVIIPKNIIDIENISEGEIIKINITKEKLISGFGMFKGMNLPLFKRDRFDDHKEF